MSGKASTELTRFDRDTAVVQVETGQFEASLGGDWWAVVGPNGGYLAAILLRAMTATVADARRAPRSLHVRYLSGGKPGDARVHVTVLRAGRSVSVLSAQLIQDGKELVVASAAFGIPASAVAFCDATAPTMPPMDQCELLPKRLPINERYDCFRALGGAYRQGERAVSGGYIRLTEPRLPDAPLIAALWDAWAPTPLYRRIEQRCSGAAPTLEASIYFRAALPLADATPSDCMRLRLESRSAVDGYFEESGEIWSPSGVLLLQSRQLAMIY